MSPGRQPGDFFVSGRTAVDDALSKVLTRLDEIADALAQQQDESRRWRTAQDAAIADLHRRVKEMETARQLAGRKTMSVPQAAVYAGVEPATMRRWLANGKLKGAKAGDLKQSRWRIRRQDLDALLERVTNAP